MIYDAVIVGGGPAGLSAALTLGRGRKRVLVCDGAPRRNAAAVHVHNFLTRDGTPPDEMRRVAREQLAHYPNVEVRDTPVEAIEGARGSFRVSAGGATVEARRILLATGLIDELPAIEGARELWGRSIFQCPYCHGWEVQDKRWGYLITGAPMWEFPLMLRGWTKDVVLFTNGARDMPEEVRAKLGAAGVVIEERPIARLVAASGELREVAFEGGGARPCDVLFTHPRQRHVDLVRALGVGLDDDGYVRVDPMRRETTIPGVYAGGDLITRMQSAIIAAAAGSQAAAMLNHDVTFERALAGELP